MAATSGRDFVISQASTALAGLRENGISVDGAPVNVTDKGDGGHRTLANFSGERSLDISVSGVWKDDTLRALALGGESGLLISNITADWEDGASLAGDFHLSSYEETGAHDGENTFTATLQSSGAWTYTPAP